MIANILYVFIFGFFVGSCVWSAFIDIEQLYLNLMFFVSIFANFAFCIQLLDKKENKS